MLEELSELQTSDERHVVTNMEITIETRTPDAEELVRRRYTFNHAPEWDQWNFSEYEEKRCTGARRIADRDWETSRHVWWSEGERIDVDVPQAVSDELAERLSVEEVNIQL